LKTYNDSIGRVYQTPSGDYHSVTTMLGATQDGTGLEDWKNRVGEEEARRVAQHGADCGEMFHNACESYITSRCLRWEITNPFVQRAFRNSVPVIDKHITASHAIELAMHSDKLKLAGRVDAVIDWDGVLSILDFKLLKTIYPDRPEYYESYFLQLLCYAQMWYERTGERPTQAVLFMVERFSGRPYQIVIDPWKHLTELIERVRMFRRVVIQPRIRGLN